MYKKLVQVSDELFLIDNDICRINHASSGGGMVGVECVEDGRVFKINPQKEVEIYDGETPNFIEVNEDKTEDESMFPIEEYDDHPEDLADMDELPEKWLDNEEE